MATNHEAVEAQVNPETGAKVFPWTTPDGYGVLANGAVEECGCEECLAEDGCEECRANLK